MELLMKYHIFHTIICQKVSFWDFTIGSDVKLGPLPQIYPVFASVCLH